MSWRLIKWNTANIKGRTRAISPVLGHCGLLSLISAVAGQVGVTSGIVTALPFDGETRDGLEAKETSPLTLDRKVSLIPLSNCFTPFTSGLIAIVREAR